MNREGDGMGPIHDFIVVGSGMTGAHAAQTLVEGGRQVLMLDGGVCTGADEAKVPEADFVTLRENDADQHRYFLGDGFEGIPWGEAARVVSAISVCPVPRSVSAWGSAIVES